MIRAYRSSIVVRQALVSTIMMLAAIALIALAARIAIERQQRAALLALIDTDIAGLTDGMMTGGPAEVARRIGERIQFDTPADAGYRLTDARGVRLAGNLEGPVLLAAERSQAGEIATRAGPALARATRLRDGHALVVARSLGPSRALVARLMALFGIAAIPAAMVSLIVGALLARRFGRGVVALNDTFGRFQAGEHAARTRLPEGPDEVATLARHVDGHLARTARLIEAQREISDNIAHELRTPLGHLDTRLLHALARTTDGTVEEELHRARDDIRAIVSLFDALLDLALAEGGAATGGGTTFDLSERIADLTELYLASAEEAGLAFTTRIAPAVTMRGEAMAMTRAVANLLDNAFKFAPAGSHVRLTVTTGPRIVVEDDGPGVPPDERAVMFERLRGSRAAGKGHGLGLALVRVIAARHGLVARFEDADPGARFILEPGADG